MSLLDYEVYILDYDGCLLDSLPMWRTSARGFIRSKGLKPEEDLDSRIPIFTDVYSAMVMKKEYNLEESIEELMVEIDSYVDENYPLCPLKKGAIELLETLKSHGKKIVVVSASGDHILDLSMTKHSIKGYFDMVKSVYNHETLSKETGSAMEYVRSYFGVDKKDILMLDDSLANIKGAYQYGIDCIAIYEPHSLPHKDEIIQYAKEYMTLEELARIIKEK